MKKRFFIKLIWAGIFSASLNSYSQKVYKNTQSSYDKTVDFKQYKSFAWLPDKDTLEVANRFSQMRNSTLNYFTHCMNERGYKPDADSPDILLELIIKSETLEKSDPSVPSPVSTTTVTKYGNPFLHPLSNPLKYNKPFTYKYFNYPKENGAPKETYIKNSITLNVIDRLKQKVVWSGTAAADLYDTAYLQMNLHPVVYDLLNKYPVKPNKRHRHEIMKN